MSSLMTLLSSYLKIGLRNLLRHKTYSVINVAGLSVGLCTALLILLFIKFEYSFDGFHTGADSIYRVSIISKREGVVEYDSPTLVAPLGPALAEEFPEVELYSRISAPRTEYFFEDGEAQKISGLVYADSSFFEIFSFSLISGHRHRALSEPYSMVLTEETAQRIFGGADPLGKLLHSQRGETYTVTGVVQKLPVNSHIRFNALASFSTLYRDPNNFMGWNGGNQYTAYIKLHDGASPAEVENRLPAFLWTHLNQELAALNIKYESYLQPLRQIHLHYGDYTGASMLTIYIFASIGGVILLIACINFINLTLARAAKRSREVGIRKTLGAGRSGLMQQFMVESILLCFIALLFSLLLAESVYPFFREMLGRDFGMAGKITFLNMLGLIGLLLLVGIMAGSYPAFYLASLPAVKTIKATDGQGRRKATFRNALIIFQFTATVTLMVSAVLIHHQIKFVQNKDPGFDKENLIVVPLLHEEVQLKAELLKTEMSRLHGVVGISASSEVPINGFTSNGYFPEGFTSPVMIKVADVDQDFLKTYKIDLVQGRNFSSEQQTDGEAYLINESLASLLGWDNPIGKIIRRNG
ncbi:MAG TPA: ABC transporter permease, partial [bacterium]